MLRESAIMGIGPSEFWGLTPRQFRLHAQGFNRRIYIQHSTFAHFFASLINAIPKFSKKSRPVHGTDLMGLPRVGRKEMLHR